MNAPIDLTPAEERQLLAEWLVTDDFYRTVVTASAPCAGHARPMRMGRVIEMQRVGETWEPKEATW